MFDHWPLTGRVAEMATLCDALAGDQHQGVVVSGRAGVGKSRLMREAADALGNGWTVRYVAATATCRSIPLGAFAQWTEDSEGTPLALASRVIAALTAGSDPGRLLVCVDDAQWLDELSALVVQQLVMRRAARVIATVRSGQPVPDAVTALGKDGLLGRVELRPLTRRQVSTLLAAALGTTPGDDYLDRMWRLSGGNVLFLRQLVGEGPRSGRTVPPSLAELVEHQIGELSDPVLDVVDLVAVAEPIDLQRLSPLVDQGALEEAEGRELIRVSGDSVYAGHPLYAEVRLNRCGALRLRRLRGLAAAAMQGVTESASVVRRGVLWLESDLAPDPEVLSAAAVAAGALFDFDLAARMSKAAEQAGVGPKAQVDLAYNLVMAVRDGEAAEVIEDIVADEAAAAAFINEQVLRASSLLYNLRRPDESWRVIDDALATARGPRVSQLLAFRAGQLALAARPAEVIAMRETADYSALDDFGTMVRVCSEVAALGEVGRTAEALGMVASTYDGVDPDQRGNFLIGLLMEYGTFSLSIAGRLVEARAFAQRFCDDCDARPATARAVAASIAGAVALATGDLPAALALLPAEPPGEDADLVAANGFYRFALLRVQALARSGSAGALAALEVVKAHHHPSYPLVTPNALLAEAWVAAARHQLGQARECAWRAAHFARTHGQLAREVLCLQTLVQFGNPAGARRLAELAGLVEGPRAPAAARYADAVRDGDADELLRCSEDFETMGDLLTAADAAAQAATTHREAGCAAEAMKAGARATDLAVRCGNATSPALTAADSALPFTRREYEIAGLVARGLTNREIAAATTLSVRTVEGHILRACGKAGVTNRDGLATLIRSLGDYRPPEADDRS